VTGGAVALSWQPAAGTVSGYVVEAGSAPGLANLASATTGAATSYTATAVPPGVYFVRVRATNDGGPGPPSNELTIVVP
jgi:hypothetical protein